MKNATLKYLILALLLTISQWVYAKQYSQEEAIQYYLTHKLQQPAPESDGRIQTLNEKGAMSPALDEATLQFIMQGANKKVLEIGGAYGKVMLEMLAKHPATEYTLNDLDERHLFIASNNLDHAAQVGLLKRGFNNRVKYISGNIATSDFSINEQYDAILAARIMHFFSPEQTATVIKNLSTLLKPQGRIYVVAITPYVKRYQAFIAEYEKRLANNESYPGYVTSLSDWLNVAATSKSQQAVISKEPFMFLDDRVLTSVFSEAGFKIITCKTVPLSYHSDSWSLDGRLPGSDLDSILRFLHNTVKPLLTHLVLQR